MPFPELDIPIEEDAVETPSEPKGFPQLDIAEEPQSGASFPDLGIDIDEPKPTGPSQAEQQFKQLQGLDDEDPTKPTNILRRPSGDIQTTVAEVTQQPVSADGTISDADFNRDGTISDREAKVAAGPLQFDLSQPELGRGFSGQFARGLTALAKSGAQAIEALGGGIQFLGRSLGGATIGEDAITENIQKFGKSVSLYGKNNRAVLETLAPSKQLFKRGKLDIDVAKDPNYWSDTFIQGIGSMSTAIAGGGGTAAGGAIAGSLMEAGPFYDELLEKGDNLAEVKALGFGLAVAGLEKIGLEQIFKNVPTGGAKGRAIQTAISSFTEGTTEMLENPIQTIIEVFDDRGMTLREKGKAVLESIQDGYNAFVAGALTGGPVSVAQQAMTTAEPVDGEVEALTTAPPPVAQEDAQVEDGGLSLVERLENATARNEPIGIDDYRSAITQGFDVPENYTFDYANRQLAPRESLIPRDVVLSAGRPVEVGSVVQGGRLESDTVKQSAEFVETKSTQPTTEEGRRILETENRLGVLGGKETSDYLKKTFPPSRYVDAKQKSELPVVYVRLGLPRSDSAGFLPSANGSIFSASDTESGISVLTGRYNPSTGKIFLEENESENHSTYQTVSNSAYSHYTDVPYSEFPTKAYIIEGEKSGIGADGEVVLNPQTAKVIGAPNPKDIIPSKFFFREVNESNYFGDILYKYPSLQAESPTRSGLPEVATQAKPETPISPDVQLSAEQTEQALNEIATQLTQKEVKQTAEALGLPATTSKISLRRNVKEMNELREQLQSAEAPADKLQVVIKAAKNIRGEVEAAKKPIMRAKAARLYANLSKANGADLVGAVQKSLTGKLPQGQFEAPVEILSRSDVNSLYDTVNNFDFGPKSIFDKANTITALTKLLGGQVPQTAEIKNLRKVFGPELEQAIRGKRPLSARAWETVVDALNAPRTLKTMFDMSAMLRQGAMLSVGEAKSWGRSVPKMMKVIFSDSNMKALDTAIKEDPRFDKAKEAGLFIAPIDKSGPIAAREEAFASRLIDQFPVVGAAARASERAYNGFLNALRTDVFYKYVDQWGDSVSDADYENLAKFINTATGRGTLGKTGEKIAGELSAVFFSPRFVASRIQAPLQTLKFGRDAQGKIQMAPAQKVAVKNLVGYYGAVLSMLALAKLAGADVEDDPRSSDFARIKIGNTRIDLSAGIQPLLRHIGQFLTKTRKSTSSGNLTPINRADVISRFLRSKLAPGPGFIWSAITGTTFSGDEFGEGGVGKTLKDEFMPLILDEVISATQIEGPWAGLVSGLGEGVGISVSTYEPRRRQGRTSRKRQRSRR